MKAAVIGATGKEGSLIVKEMKNRGIDVTAIVRDKSKLKEEVPAIEKNVYALTSEDIQSFDVLINALGFWEDVTEFSKSMNHLIEILKNQSVRLLTVGGAGSLYVDEQKTKQLKDTADFPEAYKPLSTAMGVSLDLLKKADQVNWTYISPAEVFDAEGPRTGSYKVAGEVLTRDADGKSYISYADYAIAMVDEAESAAHPNQRISVYS